MHRLSWRKVAMEWWRSCLKFRSLFAILDQVWLSRSQINETVPSYQSSLISIPGLTLNYGLHKLVYKFEVETGETKEVSVFTERSGVNKTKSIFGTVTEGKFIYIFPVELFLQFFVSDPIECNVNLVVFLFDTQNVWIIQLLWMKKIDTHTYSAKYQE